MPLTHHSRPLLLQLLLHRHRPLLREHLLPSSPSNAITLRPSRAKALLGQELRTRADLALLRHHLLVARGGAVGEVLDEVLFIFFASPPRGGLAASTLSTLAPGLDSCLAVPCEEERIPRCGRRPAKLIKFTLGLQWV